MTQPEALVNDRRRWIADLTSNPKPYTAEQLQNTPYRGTTSERIDRAAGGPETRALLRDPQVPLRERQRIVRDFLMRHLKVASSILRRQTAASKSLGKKLKA